MSNCMRARISFSSTSAARSEACSVSVSMALIIAISSPAFTRWNSFTLSSFTVPGTELMTLAWTNSTWPTMFVGITYLPQRATTQTNTAMKVTTGRAWIRNSFQRCDGGVGIGASESMLHFRFVFCLHTRHARDTSGGAQLGKHIFHAAWVAQE